MTESMKTDEPAAPEKETSKTETVVTMPPLEAAARRLEKLLGGGVHDKRKVLHTYANPAKVVRRWLGTASGAAGKAIVADIAFAAGVLLDPNGPSSAGRKLLVASSDVSMEVEAPSATESPKFLTVASAREVESWLLSLSVRVLWKEKNFREAFDLAQKSIFILLGHLEVASMNITSLSGVSTSSLFPLLARMYRYRSLSAEELNDVQITTSVRQDMSKAHNLACLRRDVDCQATLLNLMLRDLLRHSQSKYKPCHSLTHCPFVQFDLTALWNSRTGSQASVQFDVPRLGVEQPVVSLFVLQWSDPSVATRIHQSFFKSESMSQKGTDKHCSWVSYCGAKIGSCGAAPHGRNSRKTRLFLKGYENRTESLSRYCTSGPTRRSSCFQQGHLGTGVAVATR